MSAALQGIASWHILSICSVNVLSYCKVPQSAARCCKRGMAMAVKNRVTINLEDEEYEALVEVATRADRSIAWVGRHAIVEFLASKERKEVPLLATAGTGSSPFGKPKG